MSITEVHLIYAPYNKVCTAKCVQQSVTLSVAYTSQGSIWSSRSKSCQMDVASKVEVSGQHFDILSLCCQFPTIVPTSHTVYFCILCTFVDWWLMIIEIVISFITVNVTCASRELTASAWFVRRSSSSALASSRLCSKLHFWKGNRSIAKAAQQRETYFSAPNIQHTWASCLLNTAKS